MAAQMDDLSEGDSSEELLSAKSSQPEHLQG